MDRQQPLFPISTVMKQTGLTARQIRYYEANQLILPARTEGKHRLYSFQDIDRLLEIKQQLASGHRLTTVKRYLAEKDQQQRQDISDADARRLFREEFKQNFLKKGKL